MAAIAAVCRLVKVGEHIVAGDDLYGGTSRLLASVVPNAGIDVSNVDTTNAECVGLRFSMSPKNDLSLSGQPTSLCATMHFVLPWVSESFLNPLFYIATTLMLRCNQYTWLCRGWMLSMVLACPTLFSPPPPRAIRAAIRPGMTKFVFLESPTNPRMQVCDIRAISQIAHEVRPYESGPSIAQRVHCSWCFCYTWVVVFATHTYIYKHIHRQGHL